MDEDNYKGYMYANGASHLAVMVTPDGNYFLNNNILHDIEKVTNVSGNTVQETGFDAFGNKYAIAGTELCPVGYRGEYHDAESGLIYLHNRYYDPEIGRFITEDTHWDTTNMIYGDKEYKIKKPDINAIVQSSGLYDYCMNDPVNYVDPTGEWFESILDAASAVMSIVDVIEDPTDIWNWAELTGDVIDLFPVVTGVGETIKATRATNKAVNNVTKVSKHTTKEITEVANKLGFEKTKYLSHGQAVYKKGSKYITYDVDGHNGGFWKMANSLEGLSGKKTRSGTFDIDLNKIGD